MKKQPKAVYIIENGEYTELTYEEFRRREQICPLYADKLFLPLYGRLMEVSKEDYTEFYRAKRRQKYLDERSADNGDFSYDMLTTDEFSGEDILIAEQPDVCDTVVESIMTDKLRKAILKLTDAGIILTVPANGMILLMVASSVTLMLEFHQNLKRIKWVVQALMVNYLKLKSIK